MDFYTRRSALTMQDAMRWDTRSTIPARHRRLYTIAAYTALAAPILRELQDRERDILVSLSRSSEVVTGHEG